jgi:hypothetical protein
MVTGRALTVPSENRQTAPLGSAALKSMTDEMNLASGPMAAVRVTTVGS